MKRITVIVAGFLSVLLVACGGGGSDSDTLTSAELITQGDALCQQASDAFTPLAKDYQAALKDGDNIKAGDIMDAISLVAEKRTAGFEALDPPDDQADAVDSYAASSGDVSDLMKDMAEALRQEDTKGVLDATQGIADASGEAQTTAQEIGFKKCSTGATGAAS